MEKMNTFGKPQFEEYGCCCTDIVILTDERAEQLRTSLCYEFGTAMVCIIDGEFLFLTKKKESELYYTIVKKLQLKEITQINMENFISGVIGETYKPTSTFKQFMRRLNTYFAKLMGSNAEFVILTNTLIAHAVSKFNLDSGERIEQIGALAELLKAESADTNKGGEE